MPRPEVGRPLPRAADAYVDDEKWHGYVLADGGHGRHWRRVWPSVDSDALWLMLAAAVLDGPIDEIQDLGRVGLSCRVRVILTINDRPLRIRTVWHYTREGGRPRLVTAFPES
jgi:hypothetical protein